MRRLQSACMEPGPDMWIENDEAYQMVCALIECQGKNIAGASEMSANQMHNRSPILAPVFSHSLNADHAYI